MRKFVSGAALAAIISLAAAGSERSSAGAAPSFVEAGPVAVDSDGSPSGHAGLDGAVPGLPGIGAPPGPLPRFGLQGAAPSAEAPPATKAVDPPVAKPKPTRKEMLDALFGRLATTKDPDEASGIVSIIQRQWMESGSDTADLLMGRALTAMSRENRDVALALLDKIVVLQPDWAEAWNRRATLRFLASDDNGSMEDISHVLALEPRHFGALSGMGFILQRHGMDKQALTALRRALEIYPENADIRKVVDQLTLEVEGRDL